MKIITKIFLMFIILFSALNNYSYAQLKFLIGPSAGVTIPSGDYSGDLSDYYNGTKYGQGTGYNIGAVLKARLLLINIKAGLTYTSLSNSGVSSVNKPASNIEVKHNLFTFSAGPELYFHTPGSPIKPYIGIDLLLTNFSGELTFFDVDSVNNGTYDLSSATRVGIGFGAGVELSLGKSFALDFSFKYNLLNLMGKGYEGGNERLNSYIALNDDKDPLYTSIGNHPVGDSRSISTLQFNLAFLFGL